MFCESPGTAVADTVEFIEKTGTKHVGFVPDMGIFCKGPYLDSIEYVIRHIKDEGLKAGMEQLLAETPLPQFTDAALKEFGDKLTDMQKRRISWKTVADPKDLELIMPYICSFHGKVHNMIEVEPGVYDDPVTMNKEVIDLLKKHNWDGYFDTEYEGQRSYQDRGMEYLADEVEQVRRHHQMLRRLIGE